MKKTVLICAIALLNGCSDSGKNRSSNLTSVPSPEPTRLEQLQGNWERRGYGSALKISRQTVALYDFTSETCIAVEEGSVDDIEQLEFTRGGEAFSIGGSELAFAEYYERINELPEACNDPGDSSPEAIFNHVWHTFDEYYAFFAERRVNWLAQRDATRDLVAAAATDAELFEALATLLAPLDDEHVMLDAQGQLFSPARPRGFLAELIDEALQVTEPNNVNAYINGQLQRWDETLKHTYLGGDFEQHENETLLWGHIDTDTAYLKIGAMLFNLEETIEEQVSQLEPVLDRIFTSFEGSRALIVDIRLNGGGADPFALAIARRFADAQRLAVSKHTRTVAGDGPQQSIHLGPTERPGYRHPVILVTSGFTTSAAEVFTLAMRAWPQVSHIGETTNGAMSDVLEKRLPNGWRVDLSNEVYLDAQGQIYEASGIPPHRTVPVFDLAAREAGRDSALDAALALLQQQRL